jgi:hypothetical protein
MADRAPPTSALDHADFHNTNTEKALEHTRLQDAQLARGYSRDVVELVSAIIDVLQVGVHVGPTERHKKDNQQGNVRSYLQQAASAFCLDAISSPRWSNGEGEAIPTVCDWTHVLKEAPTGGT